MNRNAAKVTMKVISTLLSAMLAFGQAGHALAREADPEAGAPGAGAQVVVVQEEKKELPAAAPQGGEGTAEAGAPAPEAGGGPAAAETAVEPAEATEPGNQGEAASPEGEAAAADPAGDEAEAEEAASDSGQEAPARSVRAWSYASVNRAGETVVRLISSISGFQGLKVSYQWQYRSGGKWLNAEGSSTGSRYSFVATRAKLGLRWRVLVLVEGTVMGQAKASLPQGIVLNAPPAEAEDEAGEAEAPAETGEPAAAVDAVDPEAAAEGSAEADESGKAEAEEPAEEGEPEEAAEEPAEEGEPEEAAEEPAEEGEPGEEAEEPAEEGEPEEAAEEPVEESEPGEEAEEPAEEGEAEEAAEEPAEESEAEEAAEAPVREVRVFTSLGRNIAKGDPVYLTSELTGFDDVLEALQYQWQFRAPGGEWQNAEGANGTSHQFAADRETISYQWRLVVSF